MAWDQDPTSRKRVQEAFRKYRKPQKLEGCPCVGPRTHEPLCTVALSDITADMMSPYATKAMTTWGGVNDFKYFLPRLLELACTGDGERTLGTSAADVAAKLAYGQWTGWPETEQVALREFWAAAWLAHLHAPVVEVVAHRFLRDIAEVVSDPTEWLAQWEELDSANAAWQLAAAVRECWPEVARSGTAWPRRRGKTATIRSVSDQLGAWLRHDRQKARLERALGTADGAMTSDILAALEAYEWFRP
jgi:hypothetical protein